MDNHIMERKIIDVDRVVFIGEKSLKYPNNETNRTKYNFLWIFIVTAYVVFSEKQNLYFLIVGLIQVSTFEKIALLPSYISPTGPFGTAGPLLGTVIIQFVLILINWARNKWADMKENNTQTTVIEYDFKKRKLEMLQLEQMYLRPGDVVYFKKGDVVSVDIVTLAVDKQDNGVASFTATDLTGEPGNIPSKPVRDDISVSQYIEIRARLNCYSTGSDINEFDGELNYGLKENFMVTAENTIPAGAIITSQGVIGVVYAAGKDRKSQMELRDAGVKSSNIDILMSRFMIYNVYLLILMIIVCTILSIWFDVPTEYEISVFGNYYIIIRAVQNFMIYNGMIPLSLSINMAIVRVLQTIGFSVKSIGVNNTKLTSDLYQVDYIFSDKTGTLTKNEMVFSYLVDSQGKLFEVMNQSEFVHGMVDKQLLRCLGLCTTASPIPGKPKKFDAKNQEDLTIIQRSIRLGCELIKRVGNNVTLEFLNMNGRSMEVYQVLHEFEFSSVRKSMGVIVQDLASKKIFLYEKGAGDILMHRMKDQEQIEKYLSAEKVIDSTDSTLRTMVAAFRDITEDWLEIQAEIRKANSEKNISRIKEIYGEFSTILEKELTFLGIIGIQDELQDRVQECINNLKMGNIKIAMLTGDRTATAINVAKKSGIIDENEEYFILQPELPILDQLEELLSNKKVPAVVFDSKTFDLILKNKPREITEVNINEENNNGKIFMKFKEVIMACPTLIVSRLLPRQKAFLVQIVKDMSYTTMAIGDGANDIGAIESANIGIGIKGKDGSLAERKSDFYIDSFSQLSDLLFVQGRYCYLRNCTVANYIFYKCTCVTWALLWYSMLFGFDGRSLFPGLTIVGFNLLWTAPLILEFGFRYEDIDKHFLIKNPHFYKFGQNNGGFNFLVTLIWVLNGISHSAIVIIGLSLFLGKDYDILGQVAALSLAIVINARLFYHETSKKDWINTTIAITATASYPFYLWWTGELWEFVSRGFEWIFYSIFVIIICFTINFIFRFLIQLNHSTIRQQ